jgi:predicted ATPase/DNA-binding SARP family transcriptional activator
VAALNTGRLPVRLAPLVGRQRELQEVVDALTRSRLVTLIGPGGTGKTRLALAAAEVAGGRSPGGVCWVELAPIDDPAIAPQAVADGLGIPEVPGQDRTATIAEHIGDRVVLLVLDNCEHLAAAVADLADRLLRACASLSILTTSRELLGVDGEHSWPVPPLSLPGEGVVPAASTLAVFDAVRLFEERAQLVLPSFRLADDNADAVLQVCRRLDGLPLAIELAAAQMRVLSAAQLAERLDDIFALLVGGSRTAPARHQALRAALDWSHNLLGADERAVFRRLAVFAGGFTLTSAGQVAASGDIQAERMLELLTRLADKSLLQVDHSGRDARYYLLEIIRDYARERLAEADEDEPTRRVHLRCFVDLVERAGRRLEHREQELGGDRGGSLSQGGWSPDSLERTLDRLDAETPNLRAALEFARESGDAVAALRIAGPLDRYAYLRGHYHEVRQWMDAAVTADPGAPAALRAKALLGSGRLALLQCDYAPAVRRLEAALRLYRELDDAEGIASALQVLGSVAREQGRYARSMELHRESLAIAESAGDRWAVANAHNTLGFAAWLQGDFELATAECTAALTTSRELGYVEDIAWALISLGAIARYQEAHERAAALLAESRSLSERIGFREGLAWSLEQQGLLALDRGDPAAADLLRRSLLVHRELQDRWRATSALEDLAALALTGGRAGTAARLLAAAQALRERIGTVIPPCERPRHDQTLAGARAALGDDAFEAAWQRGTLAPLEELEAELPAAGPEGQVSGPAVLAGPVPSPADSAPAPAPAGRSRRRAPPASAAPAGPGPTGVLRIRALGEATVSRGDTVVTAAEWGYAKPRELLFLLATSPPMTRDQLGAALWPDQPARQLGNSLHTALRGLRRALGGSDWVLYSDRRYSITTSREYDCDVATFELALAEAREARDGEAALHDLQRALAAYGGDFLAGLAVGEWAQARRDELRRSFESALLATGRLHAAAGRHQAAATAFRRAVAHEPLNETAHRELMEAWASLGENARAIQHYDELTQLLADQVGVPPSAETTALYQRLLAAPPLPHLFPPVFPP